MLVTFPVKNIIGSILRGQDDANMGILRKIEQETEIETKEDTKKGSYEIGRASCRERV